MPLSQGLETMQGGMGGRQRSPETESNKHRLDGITLLTLTEYDLRSPPLEIKVLGDIIH